MFVNKQQWRFPRFPQFLCISLSLSPQCLPHSLQRFPQFIHSKNTVMGSSADLVCFCMYCVLSDPHRRHCTKEAHQTHYLEASREFVHHVRLVPIGLIRFEHFFLDRFSLWFNDRTRLHLLPNIIAHHLLRCHRREFFAFQLAKQPIAEQLPVFLQVEANVAEMLSVIGSDVVRRRIESGAQRVLQPHDVLEKLRLLWITMGRGKQR